MPEGTPPRLEEVREHPVDAKPTEERCDVVVRFAGDSGDGMQLAGTQLTFTSALMGNDVATFPDYPAEIRAPKGTPGGVSAYQVHFACADVATPGDEADTLVAMNPAALRTNLGAVRPHGTIIVDEDSFDDRGLRLAGWEGNPLEDGTLEGYEVIRVPITRVKGLTEQTLERIFDEHARAPFASVRDFYLRVKPQPAEMEALIRVGAFDGFGQPRTRLFWEYRHVHAVFGHGANPDQGWLFPPPDAVARLYGCDGAGQGKTAPPAATHGERERQDTAPGAASVPLDEPSPKQCLQWEAELLGFPASGHPLELYDEVAWDTYCPVDRLDRYKGEEVVACGLVIEQRVHHQVTGEPMKFLTLCDWSGMVETELFASTYKSYGLATVRYPVLEVTARVEPFENGRGFTLRVLRAGPPRLRHKCPA